MAPVLRVLMAEDNVVNQKVGKGMLDKFGCRVTLVENGNTALALVKAGEFDLILMDCMMPEMDGYASTRELRLLEATTVDDYLSKPYKPVLLREMLWKWDIRRAQAR